MAFCTVCGTQTPDGSTVCPACGRSGTPSAGSAPAVAGGLTDNVAGMLAYFTIVPAIVFLVMEPYNRSRFIRFHAFQCIFFAVAWTALWIVLNIIAHNSFARVVDDPDMAVGRIGRVCDLARSCAES
jgi:zinc-ribbon domain